MHETLVDKPTGANSVINFRQLMLWLAYLLLWHLPVYVTVSDLNMKSNVLIFFFALVYDSILCASCGSKLKWFKESFATNFSGFIGVYQLKFSSWHIHVCIREGILSEYEALDVQNPT